MLAWIGSLLVSILPHNSVAPEIRAPQPVSDASTITVQKEAADFSLLPFSDGRTWP
jgi:hypothetical protein